MTNRLGWWLGAKQTRRRWTVEHWELKDNRRQSFWLVRGNWIAQCACSLGCRQKLLTRLLIHIEQTNAIRWLQPRNKPLQVSSHAYERNLMLITNTRFWLEATFAWGVGSKSHLKKKLFDGISIYLPSSFVHTVITWLLGPSPLDVLADTWIVYDVDVFKPFCACSLTGTLTTIRLRLFTYTL